MGYKVKDITAKAKTLIVDDRLDLANASNTATAVAEAVTLNKASGIITTEALTTAAQGVYTLVLNNSKVNTSSVVLASCEYGTSTAGRPSVARVTPASGLVTIIVANEHASAAFDGTLKIRFVVINGS